jgi:hypothetical protein
VSRGSFVLANLPFLVNDVVRADVDWPDVLHLAEASLAGLALWLVVTGRMARAVTGFVERARRRLRDRTALGTAG